MLWIFILLFLVWFDFSLLRTYLNNRITIIIIIISCSSSKLKCSLDHGAWRKFPWENSISAWSHVRHFNAINVIFHSKLQRSTSWWCKRECQEITTVSRLHPPSRMNFCTNFHGYSSDISWYISVWTKVMERTWSADNTSPLHPCADSSPLLMCFFRWAGGFYRLLNCISDQHLGSEQKHISGWPAGTSSQE